MTITSGRFSVGFVAIIGVVLSSWCLAQNDKADPAKPKAAVPPPKITISKETTRFTEPLRPDGFVDYLEAVNRHFSKEITAENNACVLLYQAMGPRPEGGNRQPDRFFQKMGIEPLPDEGKYFQSLGKWVEGRPDVKVDVNAVYDMQSKSGERPWKSDEFPLIAAWLKDNEVVLQTVAAATERPRYFSPLVTSDAKPDGSLIEVLLPGVQKSRELARALASRAMWELAEGSQVDAWRDLMTMHRLGRLVGQGPTLIEYLVGVAIESMAINGELRFLSETKPSAKMLALYRKQLDRLPSRALVADKLDVGERSVFLDCAHRMARGQMNLKEITDGGENNSLIEKLAEGLLVQTVDWDEILKSANKWYDRLAEVSRKPDYLERSADIKKFDQDLKEIVAKRRGPMALLALLGGKPAITQTMSDVLISLLLPAVTQVLAAEGRVTVRMQSLDLAFALAGWRSEHDSYPESLDALVPKYIAVVPKDLFNGQPLKYERTADGYRFYSVGQNEKDEEGRSFDDNPRGDDLVVRMPVPAPKEAK
ncbi:MAG: hypothetical protein IAG10_33815 [Planctomycetaceae bacterium]|nr:hypothetical protein [Planctomycetaceae bacterium]